MKGIYLIFAIKTTLLQAPLYVELNTSSLANDGNLRQSGIVEKRNVLVCVVEKPCVWLQLQGQWNPAALTVA